MYNVTTNPTENIDGNEIRSKYKELNDKCEKILKRIKAKTKKNSSKKDK